MKAQMAHFKDSLEEFALKHKADIRRNPEFRRGACPCPCHSTAPPRNLHCPWLPPRRAQTHTLAVLLSLLADSGRVVPPLPRQQGPVPPHVRNRRRGPPRLQ